MTSKERIRALLSGEVPDRIGKADAPWPETRARWKKEGLPADVHANDYFGMDIRHMLRIDTSFRLPETVEEDGPDYQVVRTSDGVLTKCWKGTGAPLTLEFAVKDRGDWRKLRGRLAFMGNLGVKALAADTKTLREEVQSKVKFMAKGRYRYIAHSDHSVPPEVSFDNFKLAMEIVARQGRY